MARSRRRIGRRRTGYGNLVHHRRFVLMAQALLDEVKNNGSLTLDQKIKHMVALGYAMVKVTASAGKLAPKISELGVGAVSRSTPHHLRPGAVPAAHFCGAGNPHSLR